MQINTPCRPDVAPTPGLEHGVTRRNFYHSLVEEDSVSETPATTTPQQTLGRGVLQERPMSDKAMLGTSNYPRKENELYLTPDWCTEVLLRHVVFDALTWEPAAADGAMANILFKRTPTITTDLEPLDKQVKKHDFLTSPGPLRKKFKNIVTNPPYKLAQ